MSILRGLWAGWGKALLLALALLAVLHLFVFRWATVANTSMYATFLPGDLLLLERWPLWTGLERGDVVVFRDPVQDDRAAWRRQLLVKRIAGLPGDTVEIRGGRLYVNGHAAHLLPGSTTGWSVRLKAGHGADSLMAALGLPKNMALPGADLLNLPLNRSLAELVGRLPMVASAVPRPLAKGARDHLFPFSPDRSWSNDEYGPVAVPAEGTTVALTPRDLPLYDRLIGRYEHNRMEVVNGQLLVNGEASGKYTVEQDYYFVLGDARDASYDSRYWGFVPADHLVGKAAVVLFNPHVERNNFTGNRTFRSIPE